MFENPAQAFGGDASGRKAEGRGVALDVVSGAKQLAAGVRIEALLQDRGMCCGKAVAFAAHPGLELAGEIGQRLFGARDGIVELAIDDAADRVLQCVRRRDDLVIGESLHLRRRRRFVLGHGRFSEHCASQ